MIRPPPGGQLLRRWRPVPPETCKGRGKAGGTGCETTGEHFQPTTRSGSPLEQR